MFKPLILLFIGICLYGSSYAMNGDTLKKNTDTIKKAKFFASANGGLGIPILGFNSQNFVTSKSELGMAVPGLQTSIMAGIMFCKHVGFMYLLGYNMNMIDTSQATTGLQNTFSKSNTYYGSYTDYAIDAPVKYTNANTYWRMYSVLGGPCAEFGNKSIKVGLRLLSGLLIVQTPGLINSNYYVIELETAGGYNQKIMYMEPTYGAVFAMDGGLSVRYLFNKWFSASLNLDLLYASQMVVSPKVEWQDITVYNDRLSGTTTYSTSYKYSSYTIHADIRLVNIGVGFCFTLFK